MGTKRKLWGEQVGELEDEPENVQQNVNINPLLELEMQSLPDIPLTIDTPQVQVPEPKLFTHTIQLHEYYRELQTLPPLIEKSLDENLRPNLVLNFPPQPENTLKRKHNPTPGELEEVPELHLPAALDGSITPSLETGFRMLQILEQENLDGVEFMEIDGQQLKPESKVEMQPDALHNT